MERHESEIEITMIKPAQASIIRSAKWANFIGWVYIVLAVLILLTAILIIANLKLIAESLMDINGISRVTITFLMGTGKWLFISVMIASSVILGLIGYYLVNFAGPYQKAPESLKEELLLNSFLDLGKYFRLTTILSVLSAVFSVTAIIYYMMF